MEIGSEADGGEHRQHDPRPAPGAGRSPRWQRARGFGGFLGSSLTTHRNTACRRPEPGGQGGSKGRLLFNLRTDLRQQKDLSATEPEIVRDLQAAWDAWNKGSIAPAWTSAVPED